MGKRPAFADRWRVVERYVCDNDLLDLVEEPHLSFTGATDRDIPPSAPLAQN